MNRLPDIDRLLDCYSASDAQVCAALVESYRAGLYRLAFGMLRDADEAEDAVQLALISAVKHLGRYQKDSNFKAWLYTIAVNVCRGALRKRKEGYIIALAFAAGLAPAISAAWKLKDRQLRNSLVLIALFAFGLIPATLIPNGTARQVTEQRAEQVNQAVLHFYSQNQRYPATLAELEPRYMWQVPAPVTASRSDWCYDGSANYYRLGYIDNYQYTSPDNLQFKVFAQAGKLPGYPAPCQAELNKLLP